MRKFISCLSLLFVLVFVQAPCEEVGHECGVALVRLRQPLSFYAERYGDPAWGVKKLLSLMEKQRNRGQDGAGIASVKFNMPSGNEFLHQLRTVGDTGLDSLFDQVAQDLHKIEFDPQMTEDDLSWKERSSFLGEVLLGHLRYATHSSIQLKYCQPFVRSHGVACRHFALAGNFNMTNTPELFRQLEEWGLFPTSESDTQVILDTIAYNLDKEYEHVAKEKVITTAGKDRAEMISSEIDICQVLKQASQNWDGGYVFCGILGNGDAFVCRDPAGIRPGFYFASDEVIAVASEKGALMEVFNIQEEDVFAIKPGFVMVIKRDGKISEMPFTKPLPQRQCTFERIYFSKAYDPKIYEERKELGRQLAPRVFDAVKGDLSHVIFTYVPNSSLLAFQGLVEGVTELSRQKTLVSLKESIEKGALDIGRLENLVSLQPRVEYLISKNQKVRTFISSDAIRKSLVAQLYEVTKGVVTPQDTLVVIDDSIVRGVTLRESLVKKLVELNPKKIIFVSSAPPVKYPDCYGIDMSQIGRFVAFQAALSLLKERNQISVLSEIEEECLQQMDLPTSQMRNSVEKIYERFSLDELSKKVAELISPSSSDWKGSIEVIYQSIDGLHKAMPEYKGDWYFSGQYPTPGGYRVLSSSYLKWRKGSDARSY